jgi:hypothetical protein
MPSILPLLLLSSIHCTLISPPSRLVVTFTSAEYNNQTHNNNYTIVKRYGRRMVLDLHRPFDLETERGILGSEFSFLQDVERDYLVAIEYDVSPRRQLVNDNDYHDNVYSAYFESSLQTPLWNLMDSEPYSIHAEEVWSVSNSTPDVVVAVIDSGIANVAKGMFLNLLEGYDFISETGISKDGDGRDPDATDPGVLTFFLTIPKHTLS